MFVLIYFNIQPPPIAPSAQALHVCQMWTNMRYWVFFSLSLRRITPFHLGHMSYGYCFFPPLCVDILADCWPARSDRWPEQAVGHPGKDDRHGSRIEEMIGRKEERKSERGRERGRDKRVKRENLIIDFGYFLLSLVFHFACLSCSCFLVRSAWWEMVVFSACCSLCFLGFFFASDSKHNYLSVPCSQSSCVCHSFVVQQTDVQHTI